DSLVLTNISAANAGQYSVLVANSAGTAVSKPMSLTIGTGGDGDAPPLLNLVAYGDPGGAVIVAPMKLDYELGETVAIRAVPAAPNTFIGWAGDLSTSDLVGPNPVSFIMTRDRTVRARFASAVPLPPGLIAWWRGETDATDLIGGHHGAFFTAAAASV